MPPTAVKNIECSIFFTVIILDAKNIEYSIFFTVDAASNIRRSERRQ